MKDYKPFKLIRKSVVWYTILSIITVIIACCACYFCVKYPELWGLTLFKDISVIVASTITVSLLLGLLLEKRSKEDFYAELVNNSITSDCFLTRLSEDDRKALVNNINKTIRCEDNDALYKIYSSFENRFVEKNFIKEGYYLHECRFDISCKVYDTYIEKECVKTMSFASYKEKIKLNSLTLGVHAMKEIDGKASFELKGLRINGDKLSNKDVEKYFKRENILSNQQDPLLSEQNQYNCKEKCVLNKVIQLTSNKPTIISYEYITRTELSDNTLTVRSSMPCENFIVNYTINNSDYRLKAVAFGFIDRGSNSPNVSTDNRICVELKQWILPEDGVVVIISKK